MGRKALEFFLRFVSLNGHAAPMELAPDGNHRRFYTHAGPLDLIDRNFRRVARAGFEIAPFPCFCSVRPIRVKPRLCI